MMLLLTVCILINWLGLDPTFVQRCEHELVAKVGSAEYLMKSE